MLLRIALFAVVGLSALILSGCGTVNCGAGGGDSRDAHGGCGAHTTF